MLRLAPGLRGRGPRSRHPTRHTQHSRKMTARMRGARAVAAVAGSAASQQHPPFEEALARARSLDLSNQGAWRDWCKDSTNVSDEERASSATLPLPKRPDRVHSDSGFQGYAHWLAAPEAGTPAKRPRTGPYSASRVQAAPPTPSTPGARALPYVCSTCSRKRSPRHVTQRSRTLGDGTGADALRSNVEQQAAALNAAMLAALEHDRAHPPGQGQQGVQRYCLRHVANAVDGLRVADEKGRSAKAPPSAAVVFKAFVQQAKNRRATATVAPEEAWRKVWPRPSCVGPIQAAYLYGAFAACHSSGDYAKHMQTGGSSDSKWMPKPRIVHLCR